MRRALITGITGQDGSYLAELLLEKGYEVHGIIRRSSSFNTGRIDHIFDRLVLYHGDMTDGGCLRHILNKSKPDEVYNLAAQSHVRVSFEMPEYTMDTIVMGTLRLLEAIRDMKYRPKLYQASTSEMYGVLDDVANEDTPFKPVSPYGIAKTAAHDLCGAYRMAYDMFIACGILFNHESPRRGETFVTRKIIRAAVRIKAGLQDYLEMGNLDAYRDWGWAPDYVKAMWLMLQNELAQDFVLATGETRTVRELLTLVFMRMDMDWKACVHILPRLVRPNEVPYLQGDALKAEQLLGWKREVSFSQMIDKIIKAEQEALD